MSASGLLQRPARPFQAFTPFADHPRARTLVAAAPAVVQQQTTSKPAWAGDDLLSKVVNAAIGFEPLFRLMKVMAKRVVTQTAEKNGVPWRQRVEQLAGTDEIYRLKEELENGSLQYPDYYLQQFHAYDAGNLDWTAAFEAEAATISMAIRTWRDPALSPTEALMKLRNGIFACLEAYQEEHDALPIRHVLDVGCSVGVSARVFANRYPEARVTGLDASPHFLAVAEYQERHEEDLSRRSAIQYMHALGEQTGLPEAQFDVINLGFIIHECPQAPIRALATEAYRLLRPRGVLLITDNNPASKTIQNLPPVLFTLMKSTEPHSDEYYQMDVEGCLREVGFGAVTTRECNHRHRAVMGIRQ